MRTSAPALCVGGASADAAGRKFDIALVRCRSRIDARSTPDRRRHFRRSTAVSAHTFEFRRLRRDQVCGIVLTTYYAKSVLRCCRVEARFEGEPSVFGGGRRSSSSASAPSLNSRRRKRRPPGRDGVVGDRAAVTTDALTGSHWPLSRTTHGLGEASALSRQTPRKTMGLSFLKRTKKSRKGGGLEGDAAAGVLPLAAADSQEDDCTVSRMAVLRPASRDGHSRGGSLASKASKEASTAGSKQSQRSFAGGSKRRSKEASFSTPAREGGGAAPSADDAIAALNATADTALDTTLNTTMNTTLDGGVCTPPHNSMGAEETPLHSNLGPSSSLLLGADPFGEGEERAIGDEEIASQDSAPTAPLLEPTKKEKRKRNKVRSLKKVTAAKTKALAEKAGSSGKPSLAVASKRFFLQPSKRDTVPISPGRASAGGGGPEVRGTLSTARPEQREESQTSTDRQQQVQSNVVERGDDNSREEGVELELSFPNRDAVGPGVGLGVSAGESGIRSEADGKATSRGGSRSRSKNSRIRSRTRSKDAVDSIFGSVDDTAAADGDGVEVGREGGTLSSKRSKRSAVARGATSGKRAHRTRVSEARDYEEEGEDGGDVWGAEGGADEVVWAPVAESLGEDEASKGAPNGAAEERAVDDPGGDRDEPRPPPKGKAEGHGAAGLGYLSPSDRKFLSRLRLSASRRRSAKPSRDEDDEEERGGEGAAGGRGARRRRSRGGGGGSTKDAATPVPQLFVVDDDASMPSLLTEPESVVRRMRSRRRSRDSRCGSAADGDGGGPRTDDREDEDDDRAVTPRPVAPLCPGSTPAALFPEDDDEGGGGGGGCIGSSPPTRELEKARSRFAVRSTSPASSTREDRRRGTAARASSRTRSANSRASYTEGSGTFEGYGTTLDRTTTIASTAVSTSNSVATAAGGIEKLLGVFQCGEDTTVNQTLTGIKGILKCDAGLCGQTKAMEKDQADWHLEAEERTAVEFQTDIIRNGVKLIYHKSPPRASTNPDWIQSTVKLFIRPGNVGSRVRHPVLAWAVLPVVSRMRTAGDSVARSSVASEERSWHTLDLLDVHSVLVDEGDGSHDGGDSESTPRTAGGRKVAATGFFSVTASDGSVHVFEAPSGVERDRVVKGLRAVVARLSYHVVEGTADVIGELYSEDAGVFTGELPSLARPWRALGRVTHAFLDQQ